MLNKDQESLTAMAKWYATTTGMLIARAEQNHLADILTLLPVRKILQLGCVEQAGWLNGHVNVERYAVNEFKTNSVKPLTISRFDALPYSSESFDAVFVPHIFDFHSNAAQIFTEVSRIVAEEGYLIIMGFNPFSLFGIRYLFQNQTAAELVAPHWYRPLGQIRKWLLQAEFEIVNVQRFFFRPPSDNRDTLKHCSFLETLGPLLWPVCGGCYLVVARKHIQMPVLIGTAEKSEWKTLLGKPAIAEPTVHKELL